MRSRLRRAWDVLPQETDLVALLGSLRAGDVALLDTPRPSAGHRWSFLCLDPNGRIVWTPTRPAGDDFFARIEAALEPAAEDLPGGPDGPPFTGGLAGWLGYELLHLLESVPDVAAGTTQGPPTAALARFDTVIAVDHLETRTWIVSTPRQIRRAVRLAHEHRSSAHVELPVELAPRLTDDSSLEAMPSELDPVEYRRLVAHLRDEILAGEVFEVCLTRRHRMPWNGDGVGLFRVLRRSSPNPMSAYVRMLETEVVSSSPERFLRLDRDRWLESRPIKGTRPRGATTAEDRRFRDELAGSEKDRAENMMIVDLTRNDLGRVCEFGSVEVPELCTIESHAHTHQMVSTVRGRLREGFSAVDAIRAAFPPGSMTGAPKVAAMRYISAVEPVRRGAYAGALGWIGHDGTFDLSVVIRTITLYRGVAELHVGGAVVADSDPDTEYQETLDKARGPLLALEMAGEVCAKSTPAEVKP